MACRPRPAALGAGTLLLLLTACGEAPPQPAATAPPPTFPVATVQPVTMPDERLLDGTVEAVNEATVVAETSGRVAEILFDVDDPVPDGAVVLRIRATEQRAGLAQAEAALKEATARESEAQSRFARIRDMYQRQVVARAQFDQAEAERDAAVARLAAARAALASAREAVAYTEVRAPYAGVLTERLVRVGEAVAPGTPLLKGFSRDQLRVTVDLPQELADTVRRTAKAAVYVDGRRLEAGAVTVFPAADASGTFRARAELVGNGLTLSPGQFVKVGLVTGESARLLVPRTAIVSRSELRGLYVVGADNRVRFRQLRLGRVSTAADGTETVEVLAGLAAGETIALDPLAAARSLQVAGDTGRD